MKAHLKVSFLLLAITTACGSRLDQSPPSAPVDPVAARVVHPSRDQLQQGQALAGSYLVTFRPRLGEVAAHAQGFASEQLAHVSYLDQGFSGDPRVQQIRFLAGVDLHRAMAGGSPRRPASANLPLYVQKLAPDQVSAAPQAGSLAQVDFTSPEAARSLLAEWDEQGSLWFAEPNYVSHLNADTSAAPSNLYNSYADRYTSQGYWWTDKVGLPAAFTAIGARSVQQPNTRTDQEMLDHRPIIAVFDSGVDFQHPGLIRNIWTNNDPNVSGCSDDLHGCNTTVSTRDRLGNGEVWPFDADGPGTSCVGRDPNCAHGTHVAGIIAGDNSWTEPLTGDFAAGMCPTCQIMILRILGRVGTTSGILDSSIVAAFKYISLFRRDGQPAVRVVNASFGKFARSRAVNLLLEAVREEDGTLVVAAAGNEDSSTPEYPAAFHDAIGVAAVDSNLRKLQFSNFGPWVTLSAPGDGIISTVPGGSLERKSGTSMASPMVAGSAGLLLARYPGMGYDDLRGALLASADPSFYGPGVADGFNYRNYFPTISGQDQRVPLLGRGVLNVAAALSGTAAPNQPAAPNLNRVKPGCGTIAAAAPGLAVTPWWLLAGPLVLLLL